MNVQIITDPAGRSTPWRKPAWSAGPIAVMVATPGSVCIERQGPRPANRTVPEATVIKQRKDMVDSHRTLKTDGSAEIVFSDSLYRLLPFLERLSQARRQADLGPDGGDGLGDLNLSPGRSAGRSCRCGSGSPARTSPTATASQRSGSGSSTSPSPCAPTWTARATSCRRTRERGSGEIFVAGDHLGDTVGRPP
jgi:hypothetical protein